MSMVISGVSVIVTSATPGEVEVAVFKLNLYIYAYVKRFIFQLIHSFCETLAKNTTVVIRKSLMQRMNRAIGLSKLSV